MLQNGVSRKRVVIAGLGDSGVLTAIRLARQFDVVGISAKPALVSGQELGWRLSRPEEWARANWIPFDRFRALDRVRTVHGTLTGVDLDARTVTVRGDDGLSTQEPYDALVISTGVSNGFWRTPNLQSHNEIGADLRQAHARLRGAESVIVIGGGAAAISSAAQVATTWPDKRVDLYFPGERALPSHHPRIWEKVRRRLDEAGVGLHPGHRAVIPDGFMCDEITGEPVQWSTGQPPASADAVLWAIGRVRPNTDWLPAELLDEQGFVRDDAAAAGARAPDGVRGRRRRGHRSASQLGPQPRGRDPRPQRPRRVRGQAAALLSRARSVAGARCSACSPTAWRCSPPRARRSGSRRGRSTAC